MRLSRFVLLVPGALLPIALAIAVTRPRAAAVSKDGRPDAHGAASRATAQEPKPGTPTKTQRTVAVAAPAGERRSEPSGASPEDAFAAITKLEALSPEHRGLLHGQLLAERLRELDQGIERALAQASPPSPPVWFEEERDELANRYFAEEKSPAGKENPALAEAARRYARLVDEHVHGHGSPGEADDLADLAEDKRRIFETANAIPTIESTSIEERNP